MSGTSQITIKDIAKKFKCSPSTVSRALNDHDAINIDTRKTIQEYAKKMNYQRNQVSLSLLNKKTYSLGVIVPSLKYSFLEASVIEGLQSVLQPLGYTISICISQESHTIEAQNVEQLLASRVDAIFLSVSQETYNLGFYGHFDSIINANKSLIFIDRDYEGFKSSRVVVDDYQGAYIAVEHLIKMGCKRIAHLKGPNGTSVSEKRLEGYLDALKNNNMVIDEDLIHTAGFLSDRAIFPTKALLDSSNRPDGIFAVNDRAAIGAISVIRSEGLSVPGDIAVVGFDNDPSSAYITPSLTTISQPSFEIGREAAQLFLNSQNIEKEGEAKYEKIILPPELLIRESSLKIP
ncbi:LacI family DNA-binding transcriptional regulator [Emticicia sp. 17c]|uniref:LacI family DNA-binding transcriptional regulator n=1 Tax=Emticicia sp. 17c TaxID=3127704 RepID=UPI00301C38B4